MACYTIDIYSFPITKLVTWNRYNMWDERAVQIIIKYNLVKSVYLYNKLSRNK